MSKLNVALLGATGAVGQRYVTLLGTHPSFHLQVMMGSSSVGKVYSEAVRWMHPDAIPSSIASMKVMPATPESAKGCDVIFSAMPSEAAKDLEPKFAAAGYAVVSEASAHRMDDDVPLIVPEVNPDHLKLLHDQRKSRGWKGGLVTTPNCTVTGLAMVLKPLLKAFRLTKVVVTTMQAISGAGYPGVPSLDIVENVIPYIEGEEDKVVREATKILGTPSGGSILPCTIPMAVSCNRVPVVEGHLENLYCEFSTPLAPTDVVKALEAFRSEPQQLGLPSAPAVPIIVRSENDRPQPRLDRMAGSVPGMSVVVGRIRRGIDDKSLQLVLLSHNTIRGAAGSAILTAELMESRGLLG